MFRENEIRVSIAFIAVLTLPIISKTASGLIASLPWFYLCSKTIHILLSFRTWRVRTLITWNIETESRIADRTLCPCLCLTNMSAVSWVLPCSGEVSVTICANLFVQELALVFTQDVRSMIHFRKSDLCHFVDVFRYVWIRTVCILIQSISFLIITVIIRLCYIARLSLLNPCCVRAPICPSIQWRRQTTNIYRMEKIETLE